MIHHGGKSEILSIVNRRFQRFQSIKELLKLLVLFNSILLANRFVWVFFLELSDLLPNTGVVGRLPPRSRHFDPSVLCPLHREHYALAFGRGCIWLPGETALSPYSRVTLFPLNVAIEIVGLYRFEVEFSCHWKVFRRPLEIDFGADNHAKLQERATLFRTNSQGALQRLLCYIKIEKVICIGAGIDQADLKIPAKTLRIYLDQTLKLY